jgi:hypothetical protein
MQPVGRRAAADVDGNVEDGAAHDAHELALGVRIDLKVQAADDAPGARQRLVVLHELLPDAGRGKYVAVVRSVATNVERVQPAPLNDGGDLSTCRSLDFL